MKLDCSAQKCWNPRKWSEFFYAFLYIWCILDRDGYIYLKSLLWPTDCWVEILLCWSGWLSDSWFGWTVIWPLFNWGNTSLTWLLGKYKSVCLIILYSVYRKISTLASLMCFAAVSTPVLFEHENSGKRERANKHISIQ